MAKQNGKNQNKPNILVMWGDDIGISNLSCYSDGLMGYDTPNIDRLAKEGLKFLQYYGEQSCTAGRAAFLTGQHGIRTGLTKVGFPGAPMGMSQDDPSIGGLLKSRGYATGQFGTRGVLKCKATDVDDPTEDPRFGKVGKQTIEDTGPLTKKRMETIDDETSNAAIDYIKRQVQAGKPFFCWWNATRMHLYTHVRPEYKGRSGLSEYIDGMLEHDGHVGNLLKAIDDLGIASNTIVVYGTDNGPHMNSWPDGAMTPFRSEKNTNWEGAYRVPAMIRWPGRIKPGQVTNEIFAALDWFPTLLAAVGEPDIKNKLLTGYDSMGKTFKVHLDGYNQLPLLTGEQE